MATENTRRGRGCFFYGFVTFVLIFLGVIIGGYFGTKQAIRNVVKNYTGTNPVPVTTLQLSPSEKKAMADSISNRAQAAIKESSTLALDQTELNVLLGQNAAVKQLTNQVFLRMESNQIRGELSLRLDQFESWQKLAKGFGDDLTGRYLNGTAILQPSITNGQLAVHLQELTVNSNALPESFTGKIRAANLAQEANSNADFRDVLGKISSIEVKDGKLLIDFK